MHDGIERYEADGFLVTGPVFPPQEIKTIIRSVDALCERAARDSAMAEHCVFERDQPKEKRGGIEVRDDDVSVFILGDLPRFCPEVLPVILNAQLAGLVSELLGASGIVTHFANLTAKTAGIGSGISWHRDFPNKFISPVTPEMVRTMICLDGMSPENGATTFLRGSHKTPGIQASSITENDADIAAAVCAPGGIVAIHPLVLHGGPPNTSSRPRRNIVIQWGRKGVPLATDNSESITGKTVEDLRAGFHGSGAPTMRDGF